MRMKTRRLARMVVIPVRCFFGIEAPLSSCERRDDGRQKVKRQRTNNSLQIILFLKTPKILSTCKQNHLQQHAHQQVFAGKHLDANCSAGLLLCSWHEFRRKLACPSLLPPDNPAMNERTPDYHVIQQNQSFNTDEYRPT